MGTENSSSGYYVQTGGTANFNSLTVERGSYSLGGSGTLTAAYEQIGTFLQSGGVNNAGTFVLPGLGMSGSYTLSAGKLSVGTLDFSAGASASGTAGTFSAGTIIQSGGLLSAGLPNSLLPNPLNIGTGGNVVDYILRGTLTAVTVNLNSGGTASFQSGQFSGTTFNQTGGSAAFPSFTVGTISGSQLANYSISGGTLTAGPINVTTGGTFRNSGGLLESSGITLAGGTASFPSLVLDSGKAVLNATYPNGITAPAITFNSGTLLAGTAYLGFTSTANGFYTESNTPSVFDVPNVYLGFQTGSTGSYTLGNQSAVTLQTVSISTTNEYVGYQGVGNFTQNAGVNSGSSLYLSATSTAHGTYTFTGGTATFGVINIGSNANFNQTGGTLNFSLCNQIGGTAHFIGGSEMVVGPTAGSTGSYVLSGGSVTAGETVGDYGAGVFNQSGGINQAYLTVGFGPTGTYILSGTGQLVGFDANADEFIGESGNGYFDQTGGTNTITGTRTFIGSILDSNGNLDLGSFGGTGTYTQTGGTLSVQNVECLGIGPTTGYSYFGSGVFNQSGGANTCGTLYLPYATTGAGNGPFGTYAPSGGTLTVQGNEYVGVNGTGSFIQTGGVNSCGTLSLETLSSSENSNSSYLLQSGTLQVGNLSLNNGNFLQTGGTFTFNSVFQFLSTVSVTNLDLGAGGNGQEYDVNGGNLTCSTLQINSGGLLDLRSNMTLLQGGTIQPGGTLTIASGSLNVNASTLTFNYSAGNDPVATIANYLAAGYGNGTWKGEGINSSFVASHPGYGLAYADGADGVVADGVVAGLSSGEIEVLPALLGDATLAGSVTYSDFLIVQNNIGESGSWDGGNFLYGSTITFADFVALAGNIPTGPLTSTESSAMNSFANEFSEMLVPNSNGIGFQVVAEVPEPASAALVVTAAGLLLRRRSRRSTA